MFTLSLSRLALRASVLESVVCQELKDLQSPHAFRAQALSLQSSISASSPGACVRFLGSPANHPRSGTPRTTCASPRCSSPSPDRSPAPAATALPSPYSGSLAAPAVFSWMPGEIPERKDKAELQTGKAAELLTATPCSLRPHSMRWPCASYTSTSPYSAAWASICARSPTTTICMFAASKCRRAAASTSCAVSARIPSR